MTKAYWLCAAATLVMVADASAQTAAAAAPAQTSDPLPADSDETSDIVVTGFRQSLTSASNLKRNSSQIQDSIVAEDVGKLPDTNVAETLQRIPGVQLTRNARGEGNGYSIHGMTQNQTVLNGRGIFQTANRVGALLDFSADILSGIDVYKTATADQIEGGLGGLVNIRTAHPFDQPNGSTLVAASGNYSIVRNRLLPRLVASTSHRWRTGIGEIGVLLAGNYEQVWTGAFDVNTNTYSSRSTIGTYTGTPLLVPGQVQMRYTQGERTRASGNLAVQWQPNSDVLVGFDTLYFYSNGRSATRALAAQLSSAGGVSTPVAFQNGTSVPGSATFTGVPLVSSSAAATNPYHTVQTGLNLKWTTGAWTISPDIAYTYSGGPFLSHTTTYAATAPTATIGLANRTPDLAIGGADLLNPGLYTYSGFLDTKSLARGWEKAAKIDVRRDFSGSSITSVLAGVRFTDHDIRSDAINVNYPAATFPQNRPASSILAPTPDALFGSTRSWLAAATAYTRDLEAARRLIGVRTGDPAFNPLSHFKLNEKVWAGYLEAQVEGEIGSLPVDGNIGGRLLNTTSSPTSYQSVNGTVTPVSARSEYTNFLPSVNVRFKFTSDLFLRLAAAKALFRPDYGALNPVVGINPNLQTGGAGNPNLQPVKADQADLSLEYYFGRSNLIAGSLFRKNVTGFIQTFSLPETINGVVYQISRPRNGGSGKIQGFELNYQQFFDRLPGLFGGLGAQANLVYVDTAINIVGLTGSRPAQAISKLAYNLTGIYEKGPVSLRFAYNRRSRYVNITSADAAGNIQWVKPLQSLDFSSTFALTDRITLKFDAVNLTNTRREEYYGSPNLPQISNQFDRSFEAGVRVKL